MKLDFAVEPFDTILPAMLFYEKAHAVEVGQPDGQMAIPIYRAMNQSGLLVCIAARGPDNIVYGYCICVICPALHAEGMLAETKLIFIDPEVRGTNWFRMEHFCRKVLRDRGAKRLYTGLRIARQVPLFERLGYRRAETIMEIDL